MKRLGIFAIFSFTLAGCAHFGAPPPQPGDSAEAVRTRLGQPTNIYHSGDATLLEYATGPMGQYTWMARLGADGRLISYEQVLSGEKFATIKPGRDNQQTVLTILGRPTQVTHYASVDGDVWLYRYKEQDVWNSMMSVEFNRQGVVTALVNGPDEERENRRR
ncbi:outer membrane protein assembly factor BamE [Duganella sp. sic0402]|uniref:outer membrane protein assembly factor BamE domain-containing protein n=1 Tax=Duganella sp. sic0402 TaxID=2854786 RepID=UPI001C4512DD|nr:outer membrane protein assembly factor BamE [Duganella sp. sic0402]MBV7535472.1 outer membrane protein assembly factor BamE [Duganella sp. sic0402]